MHEKITLQRGDQVTLNDLQRAALVLFAAREVGPGGSVEQMKAVCHVLRNRVMAGWNEGSYLAVIDDAGEAQANEGYALGHLDLNDRRLQRMARDVDEIYYGHADDEISRMCARQDKEKGPLLYWCFVDRPVRPWFRDNIARKMEEHRQRGIVGFLYLYE